MFCQLSTCWFPFSFQDIKSLIPLLAALVGALVAGFVNSYFKFHELRFELNTKRREKQYNLWYAISEVIRMLDFLEFNALWQFEEFRKKFMDQIVEIKKAHQQATGNILDKTLDVHDYIYHKLQREFLFKPRIHQYPNELNYDLKPFSSDLREKLSLMRELIERDCSIETINRLLYSNIFKFVFKSRESPKKLVQYIAEKKLVFDEIDKFFRDNKIKTYDEP